MYKALVIPVFLAAAAPALAADGDTVFKQNCAACHQANGQGIPGAFPALAKDKFVVGAPQPLIATLLKGRKAMPSFKGTLKDDQIAAVLTYIRSSWGNTAPAIPPAAVAAARATVK